MIGTKTLAEIRGELRKRYQQEFEDPIKWFNDEIQRLRKLNPPNKTGIELLRMMRDSLFGREKRKKSSTRKVH